MTEPYGYKEPVTDDELVELIDRGIMNSSGDWLDSADLSRERF